jgi:hydrogenase expression/formation protein HypC
MCLGIPGRVVALGDATRRFATVDVSGVCREVNVDLVMGDPGGLHVGDWVLIHVGYAMARIDEDEAAQTLELMRQLDDVWEADLEHLEGSGLSEGS